MFNNLSHSISRCFDFKLKLPRSILFTILVIFFLYGTYSAFSYFSIRHQSESSEENKLCSGKSAPEYCHIPQRKFSKFLLFATDCWPINYAKDVFEHYKSNSISYYVDIPGAKYSHAIYTSYFTGQLPTNYKGDPIKGDHLIKSMLRANEKRQEKYKFRYIGPEWSFLAIWGKDNYDNFFQGGVRIEKEPLDVPYQHPYPYFFETADSYFFLQSYLSEMKSRGESMFAHSGVFDHRQHGEHRGLGPGGTAFPRTDKMARTMQSDFKQLKKWIDDNPEYLLILLSDHGVDQFGVEGYRMHGDSSDGNEPFILLYNPTINDTLQGQRIDVVDVAPTLAMYLEDVDIPMNSLGVGRPYYGPGQEKSYINAMKQNLEQLSTSARKRALFVNTNQVERLLSLNDYSETDLRELSAFIQQLKADMYGVMSPPWLSVLFYIIATSGTILFVLLYFNDGLEAYVIGDQHAMFVKELFSILLVYGLMFCQLLFCWWRWGQAHDGGFVYRGLSPALALTIIFRLSRATTTQDSRGKAKVDQALYFNEILNIMTLFGFQGFQDFMDFVDSIPLMSELTLILAAYMLFKYWTYLRPEYHQTQCVSLPGINSTRVEFYYVVVLLILMHLESYTQQTPAMFIKHFHFCALAIYLSCLVMTIYYIYKARIMDLIIPVNLLMLLLYRDSPVDRLVLLLLNYQYMIFILPTIEYLRIRIVQAFIQKRDYLYSEKNGELEYNNLSIAHQAAVVYAINQVFFTLTFAYGDKINFDVHPFAGRIGLDNYDEYPVLSAALMALHKYGIFAVFCVYAWCITVLKVDDSNKNRSENETTPKIAFSHLQSQDLSNWLTDTMTAALVMLFSLSNLGMYIMFWIVTRHHPSQQAIAFTLLVGTTCTCYSLLHLVSSIQMRSQRAGKPMRSHDF